MKLSALLLVVCVAVPSVAVADTPSHLTCQSLGSRAGLTDGGLKIMAAACERAALEHERAGRQLQGAGRQEEQLNEAASLYFAAHGEIAGGRIKKGVNSLAKSRGLMINVRDHGATKDLRDRARSGVQAVDSTINALRNIK